VAANSFVWDTVSRRYRNTETGKWISHADVAGLRDQFAMEQRVWADQAVRAMVRGDWTVRRWELEIRDRLKRVYLAEYMLGRGGQQAMTQADYGRVGNMLRDQYQYLRTFALDVQAGTMSEAQIAARTQLYHESSIQAFERGKAAAYSGDLILPAWPADGFTRCKARCRCRWSITETKTAWKAYWKLHTTAEACADCENRARLYAPYVQPKTTA
jgi:hypothetical protein